MPRTIHRWWEHLRSEIFWLEVTRRPDIGVNLKAPQTNEKGDEFWSYSLVKEVRDGDIVYHYDGIAQAILACSRATGTAWEDEIIWAARGSSARTANIEPHARIGWYLGLEGYQKLPVPISLATMREKHQAILSLKTSLEGKYGDPLYFPLEIGDRRPIRPMQGYLFKLPVAFLELFSLEVPSTTVVGRVPSSKTVGNEYRQADEFAAVEQRDPFAVDPALVERGIRGHALTQNRLALHLSSIAIEPRSPTATEPNFDIAWQIGGTIFVAEVKSLTNSNEEKQLRLGLGQVLRYAQQLGRGTDTVPVLVVERRPKDSTWEHLCHRLGVILAWPEVFEVRLATSALTLPSAATR